jgi:hypothetical protein
VRIEIIIKYKIDNPGASMDTVTEKECPALPGCSMTVSAQIYEEPPPQPPGT